ncbi:hypothetical protein N0V90_004429 [Kalmusia sp. IMI 367209]|nr:hypothetical protein N0V90_004429 [Kalmusia sp. IMI 367209]
MRRPILHFTPQTIAIFLSSVVLLSLSVALLVLEARVQNAFRDEQIQYPGSSMAEWLFVTLNPRNIDIGPTAAKFAVAGFSLFAALLGLVLTLLHWFEASDVHLILKSLTRNLNHEY